MLFHFIGNGSAQHPALANGIGSLIDQKFRIVFQRGIVNGIWIEGLGISKSRFTKSCGAESLQKNPKKMWSADEKYELIAKDKG